MAVQQGVLQPGSLIRPAAAAAADFLAKSKPARIGLVLAVMGIMVAMAVFIYSIVNAVLVNDDGLTDDAVLANGALIFGIGTAGLAILKSGIALILVGVVRRLWVRVESVKAGLAKLAPDAPDKAAISSPTISSPQGAATYTSSSPKPLGIHRMAYVMWAPMLLMGIMAVMVGVVFSIIEAVAGADQDTEVFLTFKALAQGTEFLGEALILSGIAFLLGSILGSLRQGGGEVQESLGVGVKTLVMPVMAKLFVGLMMMGLMLGMVQFGFYLFVASEAVSLTAGEEQTINAFFAWLGPLREVSLGLILSGIVLALGTIGTKVLPFQFGRIQELVKNGK